MNRVLEPSRRIVIMGVSGCGKSTLGAALGQRLNITYIDGDHYHPQANIDKMARGEPLTDGDRHSWLETLAGLIGDGRTAGRSMLVGCSALKRAYREQLRQRDDRLIFLLLDGSYDVILERMRRRAHFFSSTMLESQFDTLERPSAHEALIVDIDQPFDEVVEHCVQAVRGALNG